jgi:predicted enzyme related to lactoylglutathione lyase
MEPTAMVGPARAGAFVYAKDLERVTRFYEAMFGMQRLHADEAHVVLQSPDIQLLVHAIPPAYAADIVITQPPIPREEQALKFFLSVASVAAARATAGPLGGSVDTMLWDGPGFRACNAVDPEGNILQIREWTAP